jgi:hypothetical protein
MIVIHRETDGDINYVRRRAGSLQKMSKKKDRKERNAEKELDGLCLSVCVCVCPLVGSFFFVTGRLVVSTIAFLAWAMMESPTRPRPFANRIKRKMGRVRQKRNRNNIFCGSRVKCLIRKLSSGNVA